MTEPVRTHRAKSVVDAARLHHAQARHQRGLTLVEGPDLVRDVVAAGANIVEVFGIDPPEGSDQIPVDRRALGRLAGTGSPRGPVAVVQIPEERIDLERNLLVSVGVSDPGNLGTMIRTAAAFGWGFAYMSGSADPWAPKVVRAGAGGQFQTSIKGVANLDELERFTLVATVVSGGRAFDEVDERPVALLIGEESHGLDPVVVASAAHTVTIPTSGPTESLNAAVAAGIAVYELSRRSGEQTTDV